MMLGDESEFDAAPSESVVQVTITGASSKTVLSHPTATPGTLSRRQGCMVLQSSTSKTIIWIDQARPIIATWCYCTAPPQYVGSDRWLAKNPQGGCHANATGGDQPFDGRHMHLTGRP